MFNQYKQIAQSYTDGQAFKSAIMTWTQRILIIISAVMLSCSVFLYVITDWTLSINLVILVLVSIAIPFLLAVCIEGAVIVSAGTLRKNNKNKLAWVTIILATLSSMSGGEVFFHKLTEVAHLPLEIQIIFGIFGIFVPMFQIMFELNQENIQNFIKEGVDSSDVTNHILEKQTDAEIAQTKFDSRHRSVKKQDVILKIDTHSDQYVVKKVSNGQVDTVITEVPDIDTLKTEMSKMLYDFKNDIMTTVNEVLDSQQKLLTEKVDMTSKVVKEEKKVKVIDSDIVSNVDSKSLTGKAAIVEFLTGLSDADKQYWFDNRQALAEKFNTGWRTADRAFDSHFPEFKTKRA